MRVSIPSLWIFVRVLFVYSILGLWILVLFHSWFVDLCETAVRVVRKDSQKVNVLLLRCFSCVCVYVCSHSNRGTDR